MKTMNEKEKKLNLCLLALDLATHEVQYLGRNVFS